MRLLSRALPVLMVIVCCEAAVADDEAVARESFQAGLTHFEAGRFEEAVEAFRRANELSPSWRILYNIGQCEAALKHYGAALDAFDRYLAEGGDEITAEREEEVLAELSRLRLKVGTVMVRGPAGVDVLVDGVKRGTTPLDVGIRVAGGLEHVLRLERDGALVLERDFRVGSGQQMVVETPDEAPTGDTASPSGEPPPTGPEPSPGEDEGVSGLFVGGLVCAGAGAALLAVGGGFYAKGKGDYDDYKAAAARGDETEYNRLRNDVIPVDNAMIVTGFVAGGVLAATGVVLLIVDATSGEEEPGAVALAPAPGGLRLTF